MVLYSMIGLESTLFDGAAAEQPHTVHVVSVRLGYVQLAFEQKRASTSVHVIIQMLDINFECYGVNKHNLLATSYSF